MKTRVETPRPLKSVVNPSEGLNLLMVSDLQPRESETRP